MAEGRNQHVLERQTNMLSARLKAEISAMAMALGGNQNPPFSQKLTEDEQVELYLQMDKAAWERMREERGIAETKKYSEAMIQLMNKKFGGKGKDSEASPLNDSKTSMAKRTAWLPKEVADAIDEMETQPPTPELPAMPQMPAMPVQPPMGPQPGVPNMPAFVG